MQMLHLKNPIKHLAIIGNVRGMSKEKLNQELTIEHQAIYSVYVLNQIATILHLTIPNLDRFSANKNF